MRQEQLEQYVERTRDCDCALIDAAISKGIRRAKSEDLDIFKIIRIISASAVAAVLCISLSLESVQAVILETIPGNRLMTQSGAEALHGHINDLITNTTEFFGGK